MSGTDLMYAEKWAESFVDYSPEECAERLLRGEPDGSEVVIYEHRRRVVPERWVKFEAERIRETFEELWGEEFGPVDDPPDLEWEPGGKDVLLEALTAVAAASRVWACEPTGRTWLFRIEGGVISGALREEPAHTTSKESTDDD